MKIGKYPVKRTYKIARLVSDVFSLGLLVFITSVEIMFLDVYEETLRRVLGEENIALIEKTTDPSIAWKHWITLIFPILGAAVFVVYIVLTMKSHKFKGLKLTKLNAQSVYNWYALCVSLCKIPALMAIFDVMYITHVKMNYNNEISWFSLQVLLDALLILILIRFCRHMIFRITEPKDDEEEAPSDAVKLKAVLKKEEKTAPGDTEAPEKQHCQGDE